MTLETIYTLMLIFIRAGGMLSLSPVFAGQTVPKTIRVAIAGLLAYTISPFVHPVEAIPNHIMVLLISLAHEFMLGLLMGMAARIIFSAIEFAGQILATEIGLVMSSAIDPITRTDSTPIGVALFTLGTILFLVSGSHHEFFIAFLKSFEIAPAGILGFRRDVAELFVDSTGKIFLLAIQMSAPVMAVNFLVTITFAILGKAAPSMNVFSESFAVRIIIGFLMLSLTLALTAQIVLSYIRQSPELMLRLLPY